MQVATATAVVTAADKLPLPTAKVPHLNFLQTIEVGSNHSGLRDPTSPLYSAADGHWHFWCTHIPAPGSEGGYGGRIYHYFSKSLYASQWNTSGIAIDVGRIAAA